MTIETVIGGVLLGCVFLPVVWHLWATRDLSTDELRKHRAAKKALKR